MTDQETDLVVLGGGSAGYACSFRAAELGMTVTLIEEAKLGGTCLHSGCIPTKALLHSAEVADTVRDSGNVGVQSEFGGIDMPAVLAYKNGVVSRLYKGLRGLATARGINLVHARGVLADPTTVMADGAHYRGRRIVLATGSFSRTLPHVVIGDRIITSDQALNLEEVPQRAIVLGGGVIGVEFASIWRSFGAEVVVVEALSRLLPTEDEASSKALERAFRRRGIATRTGTRVASAEQSAESVTVTLEDGTALVGDLLLVAVGRGPRTADLGLEQAGIRMNNGFVRVDDQLTTSVPGVHAIGDIVAGLQLAHRGFAHGIFVAETIAGVGPATIDETGIPRVTYSDPEVASVGLNESAAVTQFGRAGIRTYEYSLGGNGKSQILGTSGFVKLVARTDGPVIGIHLVGRRMGELIGEAQLIVNWQAEPLDVANLIQAHPTQSEAIGEAHMALAGKPLHVHE